MFLGALARLGEGRLHYIGFCPESPLFLGSSSGIGVQARKGMVLDHRDTCTASCTASHTGAVF